MEGSLIQVEQYQQNKIMVFRVKGNFSQKVQESAMNAQIDHVNRIVSPYLKSTEIEGILFNLKDLVQIDSSGIGALVSYYKAIQKREGLFGICEVNAPIMEVLKVTQLYHIMDIYDSEQEALKSMDTPEVK